MDLMSVRELAVDHRVRGVTFSLAAGEVLGLIGPNGAGKSTLLHALAGLERATGSIHLGERPLDRLSPDQRARRVGLLPQSSEGAWPLEVRDLVALGRLPWRDRDPEAIERAMRQAGVADLARRRGDRLSGGERARVALARVLAGQPRVLLADEPVASLDLRHQCRVMALLREHAARGQGVVVALHDLGLAARHCDRLALLHRGRMPALGTPEQVLTAPLLSETYGIAVHVDLQADPPVVLPR